jgi:quercetin dioxygenase-like cupin family protein
VKQKGPLGISPSGTRPGRDKGKEELMNEEVAAKAFGLKEGEGAAWWWLGITLATIKATGKETGGRYTLVEVLEPDGAEAPLHVHHREDEAFWILEGELTFQIGEETIKASPGSYVVLIVAPGLRGVHLHHERAGSGAHPAAPTRRPA